MGSSIHTRLSAYLYEFTRNETYRDAASSAQRFLHSHLVDSKTGLVRDLIDLENYGYGNNLLLTYNTGLYLEGLTVLANVTEGKI